MAVLRALVLGLVAVFFVITVSLVFRSDTGALEKVALVSVAVLLALAVPVVQRLGRPARR